MKTIHALLGLLLFIPVAADAAPDKTGNCPSQIKTECVKRPVAPRRAVSRIPERPIPAPAAPTPAAPTPAGATLPPPTIGTCDPGGCWDTGGKRYNGGTNGAFLDGSGRLCQRNGVSMQCF